MLKVYAKKDVKVVALEVGTEKEPLTVTATAEKVYGSNLVEVDLAVSSPDGAISVSCATIMTGKVDFTEDSILEFTLDTLDIKGESFVKKYHRVVDKRA